MALLAAAAVIYTIDPIGGDFPFPRCTFKLLTGWDCPGCGSTRAGHALLHGRIAEAWTTNPAIFVALPLIALVFAAESPRLPRLRRIVFSMQFVIIILAATLMWTVARNL